MHDSGQNLSPDSTAVASAPLSGLVILLMEDEPILALDLQMILEEAGASVLGPATTLQSAFRLIDTNTVSCALLDVRMGDQSGLPVAEKLRRAGVPLVFHTGNAEPEILRRDWPSCPVIIKPADPASIVAAMASLKVRVK